MMKLRFGLRAVILAGYDLLAFYAALLLAYYTRVVLDVVFPQLIPLQLSLQHFLTLWWLPATFIAFIAYERLYIRKLPFWDETRELFKAITVSTIAILAIITLGQMFGVMSRITAVFLWFFGLFTFPLSRFLGKKLLFALPALRDNVIIIGAGAAGMAAARGLQRNRHLGYHVIGFLDDDVTIGPEVLVDGTRYRIFGKVRHFRKFTKLFNIDTVIVAIPSLSVDKLAELTNNIQKYTKNILLIPDVKGIALTNTELYHLFEQQLFLLKINNNLKSLHNRIIKRTFDILCSLVFMVPLAIIIGLLGILIKLDSAGPVFYFHTRIGRGGKAFRIVKFRSMHRNAKERLAAILNQDPAAKKEWDTYGKLRNDPRITRIGSFLRKTSLDELPQIINVFMGEMSLVGPRPVMQDELNEHYKELADYYFLVRPGISGLWQVSGRNEIGYEDRVRLDAWYVLNWSLWLDITLLFKTLIVVLHRKGAY